MFIFVGVSLKHRRRLEQRSTGRVNSVNVSISKLELKINDTRFRLVKSLPSDLLCPCVRNLRTSFYLLYREMA